ncbi:hypothetical protein, conserved [Babesia ovata]|uniref:Extracellular matrix-binding ebh n=1 Tax=Babesia ovata TaxID=189622 RepID=A0A2H6KJQ0_9APIC|nr:uncharacterized protein BOVATA_047170 [Babesia ovata]GBE63224.1 hypothetical protein, conserved [Babesia ovata]
MHTMSLSDQLNNVLVPKATECSNAALGVDLANSQLDDILSNKLTLSVELVTQAVETFQSSCDDRQVKQWADNVDKALLQQKEKINKAVETESRRVHERLENGRKAIEQSLENLINEKQKHIKAIKQAAQDAKEDVAELLGDSSQNFKAHYIDVITSKFDGLQQKAAALKASKPGAGIDENSKCQLEREVDAIERAVEKLEKLYQEKLVDVKKKVDKAVGLTDNEPGSVLAALTALDDSVKKDLRTLRESIKGQLETLGERVWSGIMKSAGEAKDPWTQIKSGSTFEYAGVKTLGESLNEDKLKNVFGTLPDKLSQLSAGQTKSNNSIFAGTLENLLKRLDEAQNGKLPHGGSIDKPTFEELQTSLKRAVSHAVDKVLKDVVGEDDINGKTDRVNKPFDPVFMNEYNEQTKNGNGGDGVLRGLIKGIATKFGNGFKNSGDHTEIDLATLDGYNTQRSGSGDGTKTTYYRVMQKLSESINDLENLPTAIDNAKGESARKMEKLKQEFQTLQSDVINIERVVITANQQLSEYISSVGVALTTAHQQATQAVKALESTVTRTVSSAFSTLTAQVHSLFAKQKQAELTQLHTVVTAQLREINEIIRLDSINGLKGLLTRLNEGFDETLQITTLEDDTKLDGLASKAKLFLQVLLNYIEEQVKTQRANQKAGQSPTLEPNEQSDQVAKIRDDIITLLQPLTHFNKTSSGHLAALKQSLGNLVPDKFDGNNNKLLDLINDGVGGFVKQLEYGYVSAYSEHTIIWERYPTPKSGSKFTDDAMSCANVLLSIISMLYAYLNNIRLQCDDKCKSDGINLNSELGIYLDSCGYSVASDEDSQNGWLNNKNDFTGANVSNKLKDNSILTALPGIHDIFKCYMRVCHLIIPPKQRYPCSVRDMLAWLGGLPYRSVYEKIQDHCEAAYKAEEDGGLKYCISSIPNALRLVCYKSNSLLTGIQGHGHGAPNADYPYACKFFDNSRGFNYPSDIPSLFDTLADICRRLLCSLYFLSSQCKFTTSQGNGWADCQYGRTIASANWQCKDHPRGKANEQPNGQPNSEVNCQPTSPLQSYLSDCLTGFLPHMLTSVGCKSVCSTCKNASPGQPCITPMGFWDLTTAASKSGRGFAFTVASEVAANIVTTRAVDASRNSFLFLQVNAYVE